MEDPARVSAGERSEVAIESAQTYQKLPVLWLGEEFKGFQLTRTEETQHSIPTFWSGGTGAGTVALRLAYGTCTPSRSSGTEAPSCVRPVQVLISGPGLVPLPADMVLRDGWSDFYTVRGLRALDTASGTIIWMDNGATVTIHTDSEIRAAAIASLRTANPGAVGIRPIGAGEALNAISAAQFPGRAAR